MLKFLAAQMEFIQLSGYCSAIDYVFSFFWLCEVQFGKPRVFY